MSTKFVVSDEIRDEGPMMLAAYVNQYQYTSSSDARRSDEIATKLSYWMTRESQRPEMSEMFKYAVLRGEPLKMDRGLEGAAFRDISSTAYTDAHHFGVENLGSALWVFYGISAVLVGFRVLKIIHVRLYS